MATLVELFGTTSPIGRAAARELRFHLGTAQYDAKRAIFLLAFARLAFPPERRGAPHPRPGYRIRRARSGDCRTLTRGVFNRMRPMNLRARIARLRDVLDNPERWIARLKARIERGFSSAHLVLAAPPGARGAAPRIACAPAAYVDTS
jgi:hypothetical protein